MRSIGLIATFLLAACAGLMTDMNDARNSWKGIPYEEVVRQWGKPTSSTGAKDGRESHTWVSEGRLSRLTPNIGIFVGSGGSGSGVSVSSQPVGPPTRCERTLIFQDGRVVEQSWEGDADYCSTFVRH